MLDDCVYNKFDRMKKYSREIKAIISKCKKKYMYSVPFDIYNFITETSVNYYNALLSDTTNYYCIYANKIKNLKVEKDIIDNADSLAWIYVSKDILTCISIFDNDMEMQLRKYMGDHKLQYNSGNDYFSEQIIPLFNKILTDFKLPKTFVDPSINSARKIMRKNMDSIKYD